MCAPEAQAFFSNFSVQRKRFSRRSLAAAAEIGFSDTSFG
jgi:hypothetical protein